MVYQTASLSDL